jgi:hypothetical protein
VTNPYTPEQAFARDVLIAAVNGGINRWAHVHGYLIDAPADQIRAEGIDKTDRSIWHITLADLQNALHKLTTDPEQYAAPDAPTVAARVHAAAATIRAAQGKLAAGITPTSGLPFYADLMPSIGDAADVVVQIAATAEVIH